MRQKISMQIIKLARRLFANTPIQKIPLTTWLYRKIFQLGYNTPELELKFRDITLFVPNTDATIVPGLAGGFYEEIELDVFEALCRKSNKIVDVGANIGLYCCLAAKSSMEHSKIFCFEPISQNIELLNKNIKANNVQNKIVVSTAAVGSKEGHISIYMAEKNIGTHSVSKANANNSDKSVEVPVITIDHFFQDIQIDLLKVDVEGFDGEVLQGASTTLARWQPTLFVEFVPHHLKNCGFEPSKFLDIIFSTYRNVYIVNEPKKVLKPCTKDMLMQFGSKQINVNLIATSNNEHNETIEKWVATDKALATHA